MKTRLFLLVAIVSALSFSSAMAEPRRLPPIPADPAQAAPVPDTGSSVLLLAVAGSALLGFRCAKRQSLS
ncbi:MAG: hypothetical protein ACJ8HQ_01585 [Chthoniobacterales bacterium]